MLADSVRTGAYARALRKFVGPETVVADLGTGSGIFALLACRYGARRVYAVESDDWIHMAREIVQANGCADRIEFIQGRSTEITLPERVDVIVSDLHGRMPVFEHHLISIVDARRRFLKPAGVLIPEREALCAALIESQESYESAVGSWENNPYGLDLSPGRRRAVNDWYGSKTKPEEVLAEGRVWAELDYYRLEEPNVEGTVDWTLDRAGTGHGLALWFDSRLAEGVEFTNAPGSPETIYGTCFLPWAEPVELQAGDRVFVRLEADLAGHDYVWTWQTRAENQAGEVLGKFEQSSFWSKPVSPAHIRRRSADHRPDLGERARIDFLILERMDGSRTVEEIAREAAKQFPAAFPGLDQALAYVGDLSARCSR